MQLKCIKNQYVFKNPNYLKCMWLKVDKSYNIFASKLDLGPFDMYGHLFMMSSIFAL